MCRRLFTCLVLAVYVILLFYIYYPQLVIWITFTLSYHVTHKCQDVLNPYKRYNRLFEKTQHHE